MSISVTDNKKNWNNLKKIIDELDKVVIKVGVHSDAKNDKDEYVAQYATINEFGAYVTTPDGYYKIPERSFIRLTTDENKGWEKNINIAYNNILEGKDSVFSAVSKIGIRAREDIVKKIDLGDFRWPPNSPKTIKKKKSARPLIDKGFLKRSIQYSIESK